MPYNTRRKSLSLPALGIQLPQASRAHRPSVSRPSNDADAQQAHPAKRVKRSHTSSSPTPSSPSSSSAPPSAVSTGKTVSFADRPKSSGRHAYDHTPPPSPGASHGTKVDVEGINDDIVVGVIEQLEKTGNRPHLIKELATVLSTTSVSVSNSANPTALLSSRLATYMRRPWSAIAPCPIAKELIPVHPRKVFYYLTTTPRRELPTTPVDAAMSPMGPPSHVTSKRIISPSLSNESHEDDDDSSMAEDRKRAALSPSPEIDLSMDLGDHSHSQANGDALDFPTPGSSLSSGRASIARDSLDPERDLRIHRRGESPPLEGDELEFSDTARDMRMRGFSSVELGADVAQRLAAAKLDSPAATGATETEEQRVQSNSEAAVTLFGAQETSVHGHPQHSSDPDGAVMFSSPVMNPSLPGSEPIVKEEDGTARATVEPAMDDSILGERGVNFGAGVAWEIDRPENMGIDELDDYFEGF